MSWYDLLYFSQKYISILTERKSNCGDFIRKFFVDERTSSIISSFSSTTILFQSNIFLIDLLSRYFDSCVSGVECVLFIEMNKYNIQIIVNEILNPKYSSYKICIILFFP